MVSCIVDLSWLCIGLGVCVDWLIVCRCRIRFWLFCSRVLCRLCVMCLCLLLCFCRCVWNSVVSCLLWMCIVSISSVMMVMVYSSLNYMVCMKVGVMWKLWLVGVEF